MKTKILFKINPDIGYSPALEGVCSTISLINDGIYIWDANNKPAYDALYECNPDILICLDKSIDSTLSNVLKEYKDVKLVVVGPDIPEHSEPSLACYPNASGVNTYDLQPAANLLDYESKPPQKKYESEISIVSDNDNFMMEGLSNFAVKCFSYSKKLKYPNYIGKILPKEIPSILASCKIYLDMDGHNDLLLSAMINKCPCLSASNTIFPVDYMPKVTNLNELIDCLKSLLLKKSFREEHIEKCYEFAIEKTYFHKVSDIFSLLGYEEYSKDCIEKIKDYV